MYTLSSAPLYTGSGLSPLTGECCWLLLLELAKLATGQRGCISTASLSARSVDSRSRVARVEEPLLSCSIGTQEGCRFWIITQASFKQFLLAKRRPCDRQQYHSSSIVSQNILSQGIAISCSMSFVLDDCPSRMAAHLHRLWVA